MLNVLTDHLTIANQFIFELRSAIIQKDRMRFRRNMERLGEIFAMEISKTLEYKNQDVETPLGTTSMQIPAENIILTAILRAGLPLHQGLLNYFDQADNSFISAYRVHSEDGSFIIKTEYFTCPDINNKVVIIADPMIATGSSIDCTLKTLLDLGEPKVIHVVTAIAAKEGLNRIKRLYPQICLWVGDVDDELTAKAYIVPGLGDAGDLSYGNKIQT